MSIFSFSEKVLGLNLNETKDMDSSTINEMEKPARSPSTTPNLMEYRVYPERWWLLSAVLLLNISNYAHWVAFPVVVKVRNEKEFVMLLLLSKEK